MLFHSHFRTKQLPSRIFSQSVFVQMNGLSAVEANVTSSVIPQHVKIIAMKEEHAIMANVTVTLVSQPNELIVTSGIYVIFHDLSFISYKLYWPESIYDTLYTAWYMIRS